MFVAAMLAGKPEPSTTLKDHSDLKSGATGGKTAKAKPRVDASSADGESKQAAGSPVPAAAALADGDGAGAGAGASAAGVDGWRKFECDVCQRTLNGQTEWDAHLQSQQHRKRKASLRKRQNNPFWQKAQEAKVHDSS